MLLRWGLRHFCLFRPGNFGEVVPMMGQPCGAGVAAEVGTFSGIMARWLVNSRLQSVKIREEVNICWEQSQQSPLQALLVLAFFIKGIYNKIQPDSLLPIGISPRRTTHYCAQYHYCSRLYYKTHQYALLHYTTLHCTTLHYIRLNFTTLHYTTLHYTTLY